MYNKIYIKLGNKQQNNRKNNVLYYGILGNQPSEIT